MDDEKSKENSKTDTFFDFFKRVQHNQPVNLKRKKVQEKRKGSQGARKPWEVLLIHLAIRFWHLIDSWFFLKPLICEISAYKSFLRPKDFPEIDWPTKLCLRFLFILGPIVRGALPPIFVFVLAKLRFLHALNWLHAKLITRVAEKMKRENINWEKMRQIPIPEFDWKNKSPEAFYETFVKAPHPVVLRGFLKDRKVCQDLRFDNLIEHYGQEDVLLTVDGHDGVPGKLQDVLKPGRYMHNSEVLMKKYPEFKETLETHRLEPYMKRKCGFSQMFMGVKGTGSPLHFANTHNFFYMVDGVKQWYFLDPYDTYLQSPLFFYGKQTGFLLRPYPDMEESLAHPAFK